MSLIRQIWLLLAVTMILAFMGSFGLWVWSSRGYLENQLRLKNADNAQALALSLSQQSGDLTLMSLAVSAQFDTGFYSQIRLLDPAGRVLFTHSAPPSRERAQVPAWFVRLADIQSPVGVAQVTDGWRPLGTVEVTSQAGFAHAQLWAGSLQTGAWLLLLWTASTALAWWGVRAIRGPLRATVAQARALSERRFITVDVPATPELAQLTRAMNSVVLRLRSVFEEQAAQVDLLRQQAHVDPVTGVAQRTHFLEQLQSMLTLEDGPAAGQLHLVRVMDLGALNRRLGRRHTDELLRQLARTLQDMVQGLPGAVVGRLNGGDFAMALEVARGTPPQAADVGDAVKRLFKEQALVATVIVGSTRWASQSPLSEVLAAADAALAQAESVGDFSVAQVDLPHDLAVALGEEAWRERLAHALESGQVRLIEHPVIDPRGQVLHLECPMRIQLTPEGPFEPASRWLPMALRCGVLPQIDLLAVRLALQAIERDGIARGVNVSAAALLDPGWLSSLRASLADRPQGARHLWLEVPEPVAVDLPDLLRELASQARPLGVRVGLEHAGERVTRVPRLVELGLDFAKLDGAIVRGFHDAPARRAFLTGTASMLRGLGLQVLAEGVDDVRDLQALWDCGIDGATGPAIRTAAAR